MTCLVWNWERSGKKLVDFGGEMDGDFGRDKEKTFWGIVTSIIRESHSFYWSINSTSYLS